MNGLSRTQRLVRRFTSDDRFAAIEAESREWSIEGACGHVSNVWKAGGVRYKARGTKYTWARCSSCGDRHRFTIRQAG